MALRTVVCTLINESKQHNLVLEKVELPHGEWSKIGKPPDRIPFGTQATWGSESFGLFTGTEGTAYYWVGATGAKLAVYWDNPFCGNNTFTQTLIPPASSSDPGVPDYESFDPMRPHRVKTPLEPAQFEKGSDISITYRFMQEEARVSAPPPAAAAAPTADSPRVAAAPANTPTTVQCPAGFRKVLYFGLSKFSAIAEAQQLSKAVKNSGDLTLVTGATHSWVLDDTKFKEQTKYLDPVRDKLKELEQAADLMEFNGPGYSDEKPLTVDPKLRVFTIRALAAELGKCDKSLTKDIDCNALKRVCISGHHASGWTHGRDDLLWGSDSHDAPPNYVLTLFRTKSRTGILAGLGQIFPDAFERVEDLCFSACYTGWYDEDDPDSKCPIPAQMFKQFKKLSTLWVYKNSSPGAVNYVANPPATSSNLAIITWEAASRNPNAVDEIDKASLGLRKKLGAALGGMGQSLVFDHGTMRPAPAPGKPQAPASCNTPGGAATTT